MRHDAAMVSAGGALIPQRLGAPFGRHAVGSPSVAEQQIVEIALAVHGRFRILVLDRPTTALSARATEGLFALLRTLRAEGVALIYISHQITEVSAVADRVTVPREGASAGTLTRDELSVQAVVRMQVGPQVSSVIDRVDGCKKARSERSAETAVWLHAVIERQVTAMTKGRVAKIMCAPDGLDHGPVRKVFSRRAMRIELCQLGRQSALNLCDLK